MNNAPALNAGTKIKAISHVADCYRKTGYQLDFSGDVGSEHGAQLCFPAQDPQLRKETCPSCP